MSTKCSSEPSPVAFCLLCRHGQSRSPLAGGEIPLRNEKNPRKDVAPMPTKKKLTFEQSMARLEEIEQPFQGEE